MSGKHGHAPDCRCCAGVDAVTPRHIDNAPGLPQINYRIGRHSDFLESLQARLSSADNPALAGLSTREASDFTLALADALASSLDVLSFYTERFAQEHYLRTATERLSVAEMARLIGYQLAPGVAAATHLTFTLQDAPGAPVEPIEIPMGTRVQSVPGQDELAQTFETVTAVPARVEWNAIPVQTTTPWRPETGDRELWLEALATQLQPGDAILIVGVDRLTDPGSEHWDVRVLSSVEADRDSGRTRIRWNHPLGSAFPPMSPAAVGVEVHAFRQRTALFGHNAPDPNLMGNDNSNICELIDKSNLSNWKWKNFRINPEAVDLDTDNAKITAGTWFALVSNQPESGSADLPGYTELYRADKVVHRSRSDFGISARITRITPDTDEHLTSSRFTLRRTLVLAQSERLATVDTPLFHPVYGDALTLGRRVDDLVPGQAIALSGTRQRIAVAADARNLFLTLDVGGSEALTGGDELVLLAPASQLVGTTPVALGAAAFAAKIGKAFASLQLKVMDRDGKQGTLIAKGSEICLAVARKDDPSVSEIAFIGTGSDAIRHDRDHTHLKLQSSIGHVFDRAGLRINANVAPATHGESVEAILGSGDASRSNQHFALNQAPLTFVSADTPSGRASTLEVRVNDVLWSETATLYQAEPDARTYTITQDDDAVTTLQFGDGIEGARLPSGESNVRAQYRKGLGSGGNVPAATLTTLLSRPLGVSTVSNPEPATGGEDAESLDRARDNAPLTVLTLDRAV
ncbi:MAG: hypothetical protein ABFS23_05670, partial [Pseudomonadota bacterium]